MSSIPIETRNSVQDSAPHRRIFARMTGEDQPYIHGYERSESERLQAQATSVLPLLHADVRYPAGTLVLEVGCGTGAQTCTLARNSPGARFISFDRTASSLEQARARVASAGLTNVEFRQADLFSLPFEPHSFDHVFVCFVLEHLAAPLDALVLLKDLLKPGGTITVFEGDHGSTYFHPHSEVAHQAIACQVELQRRAGGNANIGRQLYPLLVRAGYDQVVVSPRMVYVDASRPELVESFTRGTYAAMIQGVRQPALDAGIIDPETFDAGIRDLYRAAENDGVFCYTFFKGLATI
jgi:SAM-dependent methyltransferase